MVRFIQMRFNEQGETAMHTSRSVNELKTARFALIRSLPCRGPELLLVLEKSPGFGFAWRIPGGKINPGETPHRAMEREFREETGSPIPKAPLALGGKDWATRMSMVVGVSPHEHADIESAFKGGSISPAIGWFQITELPLCGTEVYSRGYRTDNAQLVILQKILGKEFHKLKRTGQLKAFKIFLETSFAAH